METRPQLIRIHDGEGLDLRSQLEEERFYLGNQLGPLLQVGNEIAAPLAVDVAEVRRLGLEVADHGLHRLPDASVLDQRVGLLCGEGELHHNAYMYCAPFLSEAP